MYRLASVPLEEKELSKLLFYVPEHETELRKVLQKSGENIYGWR